MSWSTHLRHVTAPFIPFTDPVPYVRNPRLVKVMPARQVKVGTVIAPSLGRLSFATTPELVPHGADVRELGAERPGEVVPSTVPGSDVPINVHQSSRGGTVPCLWLVTQCGSDYIEWSAWLGSCEKSLAPSTSAGQQATRARQGTCIKRKRRL